MNKSQKGHIWWSRIVLQYLQNLTLSTSAVAQSDYFVRNRFVLGQYKTIHFNLILLGLQGDKVVSSIYFHKMKTLKDSFTPSPLKWVDLQAHKSGHRLYNLLSSTTGVGKENCQDSPINKVSVDEGIPSSALLYSNSNRFPRHQNTLITANSYSHRQ